MRHRTILALLWMQAAAVIVVGLVTGHSIQHSMIESAIPGAIALLASGSELPRTVRSTLASLGLITCSAIYVHLTGGYVEVHFHFFIMLSVIALYQDWVPFLLSIAFVAGHHGIMGAIEPSSVYNHTDAVDKPWKWAAIHAGFVSAACVVYVVAWQLTESASEMTTRILRSVGEGIMGIDARGNVTFMNPAAERLTGYKAAEISAAQLPAVFAFSRPEEIPAPLGTADADGGSAAAQVFAEGSLAAKDGHRFPAEFIVNYLPDRNLTVLALKDVSRRKQAEQAVRSSEEKFSKAFHHSPLAISITDAETNSYVEINDAFVDLSGHSREETIGRSSQDLRLWANTEDRNAVIELLRSTGYAKEVQTQFRTKTGEILDCLVTVDLIELDGRPCVLSLAQDITDRLRADQAIRESEERFRALIERGSDLILVLGQDGAIEYASPSVAGVMGYDPEEVIGRSGFGFVHPDDVAEVLTSFQRAVEGINEPVAIEFQARHRDGTWLVLEAMSGRIADRAGAVAVVVNCRDVSQRKQADEMITHLAYHDGLTGLPNRTLLEDRLDTALAHARRENEMLALVFIDLDEFKLVNDTLGHSVGDELLKAAAGRLSQLVRDEDTVARVGGDEFVLLLSNIGEVDEAVQVAERVRESLRQPYPIGNLELTITTSVGITVFPDDGDTAETLLQNADTAMYRAKAQGRDSYELYAASMRQEIHDRVALENDLRQALERGEFVVYYQPIVDMATGEITGCEALVRWQHPERGLVMPGEFIGVAERTGLIAPLSEWVLREACRQHRAWQDAGMPPIPVAVNISSHRFQYTSFGQITRQTLADTGLDPRYLHLEVTEGVLMEDVERAVAVLKDLRDAGIRISLDDFGTGYSSLSYLRNLPIDAVKIDRSFVAGLGHHREDDAIVVAVIELAQSLGLDVIAEGVETEAQLAFLQAHGCGKAQGFLFARPMPAADFARLVLAQHSLSPAAS